MLSLNILFLATDFHMFCTAFLHYLCFSSSDAFILVIENFHLPCRSLSCLFFILAECSTTTSSDDVDKQEHEEISDEDETYFFDTKDSFSESSVTHDVNQHRDIKKRINEEMQLVDGVRDGRNPGFERRKRLPVPVEKEKGVNLWSMIKDNVGKDLTRVCLPVYFNEPISSLQKCFEDFEYSDLLDQAYEHGRAVRLKSTAFHNFLSRKNKGQKLIFLNS